jgi:hypothetical protein
VVTNPSQIPSRLGKSKSKRRPSRRFKKTPERRGQWGNEVHHHNNTTIIERNRYTRVGATSHAQAPQREIDRRKSLSVGLRGGAAGTSISDEADSAGLGLAIGYRVFDPIGVEVSYINYGEELEMDMDSPVQASGKLFLYPSDTISPYVTAGVSVAQNSAAMNETDLNDVPNGLAYGHHGGVGVQLGLGRVALNVEGQYMKFSNVEEKGKVQGIIGLDYHF